MLKDKKYKIVEDRNDIIINCDNFSVRLTKKKWGKLKEEL